MDSFGLVTLNNTSDQIIQTDRKPRHTAITRNTHGRNNIFQYHSEEKRKEERGMREVREGRERGKGERKREGNRNDV